MPKNYRTRRELIQPAVMITYDKDILPERSPEVMRCIARILIEAALKEMKDS